tara:strand:+ start:1486 stop:2208 length:723 start_codon:yes stop_codon:yes gene_type:complete
MKIEKRFFMQNGYLILNDAVKKSQLNQLNLNADQMIRDFQKGIDRRQSSHNSRRKHKDINKNGKLFFGNQCEYYSHINTYAKSNFLKKIVQQILGKKIYLFNEQLVNKSPNSPSSFSWHQDSGYIHFRHKPYLSIWLALTDTNLNNGALSIIPTNLNKIKYATDHKWQEKSKDLGIKVNNDKKLDICVKAGTLVLFSSLTPHSSGANKTNKNRKAYLSQYSSENIIDPFNGIQRGRAYLM